MTQTPANVLIAAGLSPSMAYHAVNGVRNISVSLALWLLDQDGIKVGPLEGKTSRQIDTLRSIYTPSAPKSVLDRRAANDTQSQSEAA